LKAGIHGLPESITAAIFDFDETMIDLEAQHGAAHRALCEELGSDYEALPLAFRTSSGMRIIDDIREMRRFFGWSAPEEELFAMRHRHFLRECRTAGLQLMPGVEAAVRALHERGLILAVTSSAVGDAIDEILRRFHIRDLFQLIVDGSEVTHGKPDPEAYLLTARKLKVEPRACVVFEDSRVGVLAAKRAGMTCVAVRNVNAHQWQDLSAADVVMESFEELLPLAD
jgi:HAD superfamily hydrolase (TIGR01509 family)